MDAAFAGPLPQLQHPAESRLKALRVMQQVTKNEQGESKKNRRMVFALCLVALSFYVAFIVLTALGR